MKTKDIKISLGVDRETARPKRNLPLQFIDYAILGTFGCIATILMFAAVGIVTGLILMVFNPDFIFHGMLITIFLLVSALIGWLAYMFGMR